MGKGFEVKFYTGDDEEYQQQLRNQKPKPHRCDDRIEDLCQVITSFAGFDQLKQAWKVTWVCFNAEEGQEPRDPYVMLQPTDPLYKLVATRRQQQQQQASAEKQQEQSSKQQPADKKSWCPRWGLAGGKQQ